MKILVVEDEKKVAKLLQQGLEEEQYEVAVVHDGEQGRTMGLTGAYDLIILDILLPKVDGISVLRDLREKHVGTPVLMLTARSSTENKVEGLESGADDYLTKPFAFSELNARVKALLRRGSAEKSTVLKVGDLHLDTVSHKAKRGERVIDLTAREYALLEYFMRNSNRVLTRTIISEHIWNYNFDTGTNVVDVMMRRLRAKVDDPFDKKMIQTIRGVGYVLNAD